MTGKYGAFLKYARINHDPPLTAKELADRLHVKPPFITDIEKGRRLPSLENQKKIKNLLASSKFPENKFDDLAAIDNDDPRVVAEDVAAALRNSPQLCEIIRKIILYDFSQDSINKITLIIDNVGECKND